MVATFQRATTVISGLGSIRSIADSISAVGGTRIALVADRGVADAGLLDDVLGGGGNISVAVRLLIDPDPDLAVAEAAALEAVDAGCNAVLAIGGGSGLCAAKAVAIRLTNKGPIGLYEGEGQIPNRPAPTIAVPTTAGSGSEVSNALVLHEAGRTREIGIRGSGCEPRFAILDGTVLRQLPRKPMVFAALDALTHAVEALWTRRRSFFTDALAVSAVDTILKVLPLALPGAEVGIRRDHLLQQLLEASCAANLACGNAGLGLVHALSSAPSVRLPHGYQNGSLLLHVADFNAQLLDPAHRRYVERIAQLYLEIGFPGQFAAGELDEFSATAMVAASSGHPFRANNIRPSTDGELRSLLSDAQVGTRRDNEGMNR